MGGRRWEGEGEGRGDGGEEMREGRAMHTWAMFRVTTVDS